YSPCPGGTLAGCKGNCMPGTLACNMGVKSCGGGQGPMPETCDGTDEDCNGKIDDPFTAGYSGTTPLYNSDVNNCGKCKTVCGLPNAVNGCHTDVTLDATSKGVCFVVQCDSSATAGFAYVPVPGTCGGTNPPENGPSGIGCNYPC